MINAERVFVAVIASLLVPRLASASAQPREEPASSADETELSREAENPVGNLVAIPIQGKADFGMGPYDRVRNTVSILPTFGFALTDDVSIVSRTSVPIVSRPDVRQNSGYTSGLGDITETVFAVPPPARGLLWGVGPTFLLPTATQSELGAGQLGLGPSAAVLMQPKPWTFGLLASQLWSVAGPSDRPAVDQLSTMPFVAYHFASGWYLNAAPIVTTNWNAGTLRNMWTVPVGGGGGKVFFVGEVPLNVSVGAYWNVIRPEAAPSMSAQATVALLLR